MAWGEALAGGVLGFFGSIPVAGPVALVVVTRGLAGDRLGARGVALGAGLAEGLLAGLVFGGMGLLVTEVQGLVGVLEWIGAVALVGVGAWFGYRGLGAPSELDELGREDEGQTVRGVLVGMVMVVGNPGILGTWSGAVAALEGTGVVDSRSQSAWVFGCAVAIGVVGWFWLLIAALRRWRGALDWRMLDFGVRGIGVVLIAAGVYAAFRAGR